MVHVIRLVSKTANILNKYNFQAKQANRDLNVSYMR